MDKFDQPWGFSKLDTYRTCPRKFKYQFIDKLLAPSSPAMERGAKLHDNIESYLNGWSVSLDPEVVSWKPAFDFLKQEDFKSEQNIGIDKNWVVLSDWFNPNTWLRIKMDCHYKRSPKLYVIDFKTGKFREPSTDQVELYAIAGISMYPEVEEVIAEFWFIDTGDTYKKVYSKDKLIQLRKKYERESSLLYKDELWKPTPSRECRFCPYSRTKGGPCEF